MPLLPRRNYQLIAEPRSGFDIAFNMFDMDGNQKMDKKEFLVVSIRHEWLNIKNFGNIQMRLSNNYLGKKMLLLFFFYRNQVKFIVTP